MTDLLSRDLEIIATEIPAAPRGLAELRQLIASLPPPSPLYLPGTIPGELPTTEEQTGTLAAGGSATADGTYAAGTALPAGSVPGGAITPGTVGTAQIRPRALTAPLFAESIEPVMLVTNNPTLPNATYPVDTIIFNTTEKKLYKNVAEAWVGVVNATDLSGQITTTQITNSAITTDKINANAVTAGKIAADTITAGQIAAGAIGTSEIAAGAVTTAKLDLEDEFGSTILTSSGYGPAWVDFAHDGLYNAAFASGAAENPLVPGRTTSLPYWTTSVVGTPTAKIVESSAWPGGRYVSMSDPDGTDALLLTADLAPVSALGWYNVSAIVGSGIASGGISVRVKLYVTFYKADGTTTTGTTDVLVGTWTDAAGMASPFAFHANNPVQAPRDARYIEVVARLETDAAVVLPRYVYFGGARLSLLPPGLGSGDAFPSITVERPSTGDRWFRTDLGMEFYYDGTRWLSTQLFFATGHPWPASATWAVSLSATQGSVVRWLLPDTGLDLYVEKAHLVGYVATGGTALGASHKWGYSVGTLSTANAFSSLGTAEIASGSNEVWYPRTIDIDTEIDPATYPNLRLDITKTGTPGALNITAPATIQYRLVAT
ncbi:MAG: hypothetical protein MUE34_17730 [Acidimicrobiales bacterium]|jgi:hypothetical protein|nr:hypothetical protein [Acidimicrobiales bacterium]